VYLWNATTGDIQLLYEAEDESDIVTSVSWMNRSNILAIGTTSSVVHLWDAEKF
jgi:WD40 repeat protein